MMETLIAILVVWVIFAVITTGAWAWVNYIYNTNNEEREQ